MTAIVQFDRTFLEGSVIASVTARDGTMDVRFIDAILALAAFVVLLRRYKRGEINVAAPAYRTTR